MTLVVPNFDQPSLGIPSSNDWIDPVCLGQGPIRPGVHVLGRQRLWRIGVCGPGFLNLGADVARPAECDGIPE